MQFHDNFDQTFTIAVWTFKQTVSLNHRYASPMQIYELLKIRKQHDKLFL